MSDIRQPIISVLGHVDAGKTTLLDYVRGSLVAEQESGGITQMIGSTAVPLDKIHEICGDLLDELDTELDIPGLLFIDTPGHAAFTSLRRRGGSLSDIAVVVVDVKNGVQPQTEEAIEILRESGTPFVIALNKIDTIPGWKSGDDRFIANYPQQTERVQKRFDEKLYELMGEFSDMDFTVDRYDNVDNFTKKIGVVPISAETGEGIPDLLMVMSGLAQRYLADRLEVHEGKGRGTVLEVNEVQGFGTTVDVILYDGRINKEDTIIVGNREGEPIVTNIKALLEPNPLSEIRTEKDFQRIETVAAAAGVKISAPELDDVVAGVPVRAVPSDDEDAIAAAKKAVKSELERFDIETQQDGIVVRADSLGSLEALMDVVAEKEIAVKKAEVGKVSKKDVIEAGNEEDTNRAILAFNTSKTDAAEDVLDESSIKYIESDIIYDLTDEYEEWVEEREQMQREQVLDNITRPAKFRVMPDHVFRSSDPAVVGVEILEGVLNTGSALMDSDGNQRGRVKAIQDEGESIDAAEKGDEVAVSITDITIGRQVDEGDELYTDLTGKDYKIIQRMEDEFGTGELRLLEQIVEIKDQINPRWKLG